jgi:hypothetical protein
VFLGLAAGDVFVAPLFGQDESGRFGGERHWIFLFTLPWTLIFQAGMVGADVLDRYGYVIGWFWATVNSFIVYGVVSVLIKKCG